MYNNEVFVIGNHNLKTTNFIDLSVSLAERFNINVDYGYPAEKEYIKLLGATHLDEGYVIHDTITHNFDAPTCIVVDDYYQNKLLLSKFGDKILKNRKYWFFNDNTKFTNKEIIAEKKKVYSESYHVYSENTYDFPITSIHQDYFKIDTPYIANWKKFKKAFQKEFISEELRYVRNYLYHFVKSMGGDKIFLFHDKIQFAEIINAGKALEMEWDVVSTFLELFADDQLINIANYFSDDIYRHQIRHSDNDFVVFVDDFSDFK